MIGYLTVENVSYDGKYHGTHTTLSLYAVEGQLSVSESKVKHMSFYKV